MSVAMTETRTPATLPRALRRALSGVERRLRAVDCARGLGTLLLTIAVVAATAMTADFAYGLSFDVRLSLWSGCVIVAAGLFCVGVLRPLFRRLSWNELAAVAQSGQASFEERLTSAVSLLRDRPHGSATLIADVVDQAVARTVEVDLRAAIPMRGALVRLAVGVACALAVIAPAVIVPDPCAAVLRRFVAPWLNIERVGRFVIDVAPGDAVVALGSDVAIEARVRARFGGSGLSDVARLKIRDDGGNEQWISMTPRDESNASTSVRAFAVTLPSVTGDLAYVVSSGSVVSRRYRIRAVAAPAIAKIEALVEPPSYTRRPAALARDPARIEAWEDSRVHLELESNKPLAQVDVVWPTAAASNAVPAGLVTPVPPQESQTAPAQSIALQRSPDGLHWSATLSAEASGPFAFRLRDEFGFESEPDAARRLIVVPDAPPILASAGYDLDRETNPDDVLAVAIAARDDVAVASLDLEYNVERNSGSTGETAGKASARATGLRSRSARGEATLSLKSLALQPGDAVSYRVRVADNRPAPRGPNVVLSEPRRLRIVAHSESLQTRDLAATRAALRSRIETIRKTSESNRAEAGRLRERAEVARRDEVPWDDQNAAQLEARAASTRVVTDQLEQLALDLADEPTYRTLSRPARQVAEVENEAARATIDAAQKAKDAEARAVELRHAESRLAAVTPKVDELLRKFDELSRVDDDRRRLGLLAERQDDLAARVDAAAQARDDAPIAALEADQERLRRELDELLKSSPALRAEALAAQAREADELAIRARALSERQREEARRDTDLSGRAGEFKQLAERQRAIEDDARRLALRVNEPLQRNARAGVDAEALARAVDPIERADLDAARERTREAERALSRLTRDLEDLPNDPKALARRLADREETLKNETVQAVREAREHPPQTPEGKAALADRLKPLTARQEAIARASAAIQTPPEQRDAARAAAAATSKARDDMRDARPRDVEQHQNEARDALRRLADALPEPYRRRDRAREQFNQARAKFDEVEREIDRHLRETAPKSERPEEVRRAIADLSQRVEPLVAQTRAVAAALTSLDPEPRMQPQRDRAARRAKALADALAALRRAAAQPDPKSGRNPTFEHLKAALPVPRAAARASLDRLRQKFEGEMPADDLALELARDARTLEDDAAHAKQDDATARRDNAATARRLANAVRNLDAPDAISEKTAAVQRANEAAHALGEAPDQSRMTGEQASDPKAARVAITRAAEAAEALASKLRDEPVKPTSRDVATKPAPPQATPKDAPPIDPELGITRADAAESRELAKRQRHVREELQALLGTAGERQEAMRARSTELGREFASLRDRARELSPRSYDPAHNAADLLGRAAPEVMDRAADALHQGRPAEAQRDQRNAADSVEQAARRAEDLAAALRADRPDAPRDATPSELAGAQRERRAAAASLAETRAAAHAPQSASAAAAAMRAAANRLRAASRSPRANTSRPTPAPARGPAASAVQSTPIGDVGADFDALKAAVRTKTGRAWGELPGHLRTEILQMSQGRYRDDYARLIELYFREIASDPAARDSGGRP